jgi:hypothetical protein
MRDVGGADSACRARQIFDDHGLAERTLHPISQNAPKRIRRPAGRERHDNTDRPRRISLGWCGYDACSDKSERN